MKKLDIKKINAIFDKYDLIGVKPLDYSNTKDEYFHISVNFAKDASIHGTINAFNNALITMFSVESMFPKLTIRKRMLQELVHVTGV